MATSLVSTGVQFPDATIQTTAADNMRIKSIQRGSITLTSNSETATIASVDTSKTELRFLGNTLTNVSDNTHVARIQLTNSTSITASRTYSSSSYSTIVSWELTEWY